MGYLEVRVPESLLHLRGSPAGQSFSGSVCRSQLSLGTGQQEKNILLKPGDNTRPLETYPLACSFTQLLIISINICGVDQGHTLSQWFSNLSVYLKPLQGLLKRKLLI